MTQAVAVSEISSAEHTPQRPPYLQLFLVSFLILFLELACIRFFASTVVFLTFFTNIVLLASFLGMSVGLLTAGRRVDLLRSVVPLCALAVTLALAVLWAYDMFQGVTIDVGGQRSPQVIYFGTEYRPKDPSQFVIPMEVIAGGFFALVALMFVGLGQYMGRAFDAIPNRVWAYSVDVLGSLAGIATFAVASYLQTPPVLWFAWGLAGCFFLMRRASWAQVACAALIIAVVTVTSYGLGEPSGVQTHWSPYYKIRFDSNSREIDTNNIGHQVMSEVMRAPAYLLPHALAQSAPGGRSFDDVLIIGAGSGNDVAAALAAGAKRIDAVEIDPVIQDLGSRYHPDGPYDDSRVTVHLDDGRSFVRKTDRKYDLVIYALVDSLVLHSGYSSLRLESFLFTTEAIEDVKRVLKDDGVFAMYNYYRQGWVVGRLHEMAKRVFGTEPMVISMPGKTSIKPDDSQAGHITFLLVGNQQASTVRSVREMLSTPGESKEYWAQRGIGLAEIDTAGIDLLPTDDWPSLYLRHRSIPALNVRGMVIIAALSGLLLHSFAPLRTVRLNWQMFFLGAGFMLLETKGVVHMALLFGSTWVVNSVVFAAILVMILLANFHVLAFRPRRLWPYYLLLAAALLLNALVPMSYFLSLPGAVKTVTSCALVFVPVFFAGVIFATVFRDSARPDIDFGSNVAGIILGGLSEYFSLILGFNHLLLVALGFYFLSAVLRPRAALKN